ncbi:MAG TPA: c-type cytochrome [Candidatus Methylomirabilis sp.]|nr:c-type cytochrome [Candidatus Methylomirabilis sp.]
MMTGRLSRRLRDALLGRGSRLEQVACLMALVFLGGSLAVSVAAWASRVGSSDRVIDLVARQPAAGGWSQDRIVVKRGERVRLRIRSEDVVHGFTIGRLGVDAGLIQPGKTVDVEFVPSQSGEYTFYCTAWCDPNHPRMRGVLEVRDSAQAAASAPSAAKDVALQDLDMPREAAAIPTARPSVSRGAALYSERCATCHGVSGRGTADGPALGRREALENQPPAQVFQMLGGLSTPAMSHDVSLHRHASSSVNGRLALHGQIDTSWSDQDRWDSVAYLWSLGTTPERVDLGRRLFAKNCAACHGVGGAGDGPGGRFQPKKPANLSDPRRMLAGTSALYTAKIRRGGMGTGMPYWGSIFTEDELAALVSYVWTFSLGGGE